MHANPSATVRYSTPSGGRCGSGRVNRGSRTRPCNAHRAVRDEPRRDAPHVSFRPVDAEGSVHEVVLWIDDEEAGVFRRHVVGAGEYSSARVAHPSEKVCRVHLAASHSATAILEYNDALL
eukprot:CAMPEP_0181244746 /NCGR_PEP_ID=MMETSP1096-20121128/43034_1 /TAXON_ID=156174 ORGANISM="Chrysochromulina ericina, Strain CCMP281" /NCGR_SAMPLE_ID=MMETSP1096 /ASSEMBLY_ACC=CAM_ASM_000453 /LENGTH=120 /DNA_ID=CAMNT_0023341335 /DNA_START=303 /DNA_END=662 /DNA_ORIENTATION=+